MNEKTLFMEKWFKNGVILINDIMNGRSYVTYAAIGNIREYLLNPNLQPTNCSTTTKVEEASGKGRR